MKHVLLPYAVSVNLLLVATGAIAGDNAPGQNRLTAKQTQNASPARTHEVVIESNPPGSLIAVNNTPCGRAPCRLRITSNTNSNGVIEIKAIPFIQGRFVRTQFFAAASDIPNRLEFDNRVPPPDPAFYLLYNF